MKMIRTDFCKETQNWSETYRSSGVNSAIPVMDIEERLRVVESRLLIVAPGEDMISKYPALAEAYREYKLIERLTIGNDQA
jgi:hypothetical protein